MSIKKIHLLSEETINSIAAGEVIENPSSVVKELIDNSLDAKARMIKVEIKGGGFQSICVIDDGCGMSCDDALLCFERHTTSKISSIHDLNSLLSMGFRGEALSSISAISRVTLLTSLENELGTLMKMEGNNRISIKSAVRQRGTTILVESLFYNVPGRKKYQKNPQSSSAAIHKLLVALALSYPEVGFELVSNGETILQLFPSQYESFIHCLEQRIKDLFPDRSFHQRSLLEKKELSYSIRGFFCSPSEHRINRSGQYIFVNRRLISSPLISYAVKEGYGERLSLDRHPLFILHFDLHPHLIDVNVHPQKKEIRFQEPGEIKKIVKENVSSLFHIHSSIIKKEVLGSLPISSTEASLIFRETKELFQPSFVQTEQVIGLFQNYLLLDGSTVEGFTPGIVWVNIQKIQECLLWNRLNQSTKIFSQGLLLPLNFETSFSEDQLLKVHEKTLIKWGFSIHQSGKNQYLVESIPSFIQEEDVVEVIRLMIHSKEISSELIRKVARFLSKRKKYFLLNEALYFWEQYKTHALKEGVITMEIHEIEKLFQ